jgi:hypothetical protein
MTKLGRNEPCRCGSGKKYKKCCLLRTAPGGYSRADRESALLLLDARLEADATLLDELRAEFYEDVPELRQRHPQLVEMSSFAFQTWAYFDAEVEEDGSTLADIALRRDRLFVGQRKYIEIMGRSTMRLYEVVDTAPDASVTLRDLLGGDPIVVQERSASRELPRWTVIAARVVSQGRDDLPPVLDGGLVVIPAAHKDRLLEYIRGELDRWRAQDPGCPERVLEDDLFKTMAPTFHRVWRTPTLPRALVNYDGDPQILCELWFDLQDATAACERLDHAAALTTSDPGQRWTWDGQGAQRAEPVIFGFIERKDDRLQLLVNSENRAERGRRLLEEILGPAATYRVMSTRDPLQALATADETPLPREPEFDPETREAVSDAVEAHLYEHYEKWLDEPVPLLADRPPREAATSPVLRPRLVDLLKQMEIDYAFALSRGDPAFDPSWIWDELDLRGDLDRDGDHHLPPPLGHERIAALVPGLAALAEQIAARVRGAAGGSLTRTIARAELMDDLGVRRFLKEQTGTAGRSSADLDSAPGDREGLAAHLELRANFELHLRKVFWVDESLSWTLGATRLDIGGSALRLPFGAFAVVFTDRYALGLGERALSRDAECPLRGVLLKVVTAYVVEIPAPAGGRGLRIAITLDAFGEIWPHLLVRDLWITPDADLDTILTSRFPGADDDLAPIFACTPLRSLVHLVLNAILYATSADARAEHREPSPPAERRPNRRGSYTSEAVHYLPGTIDIHTLRAIQRARRGSSDFQVIHRAMVRGHWRHAGPDWKDQRLRWIKPYWRGPSTASTIERQYRLLQ